MRIHGLKRETNLKEWWWGIHSKGPIAYTRQTPTVVKQDGVANLEIIERRHLPSYLWYTDYMEIPTIQWPWQSSNGSDIPLFVPRFEFENGSMNSQKRNSLTSLLFNKTLPSFADQKNLESLFYCSSMFFLESLIPGYQFFFHSQQFTPVAPNGTLDY